MAIKKQERMVGKKKKKKEKKEEQQTNKTLSEKKEEARNASDQRDKGWIHLIRVHDTTHWADNNTAGQKARTNRMSDLVKHRDHPPPTPHSLVHRKWTI